MLPHIILVNGPSLISGWKKRDCAFFPSPYNPSLLLVALNGVSNLVSRYWRFCFGLDIWIFSRCKSRRDFFVRFWNFFALYFSFLFCGPFFKPPPPSSAISGPWCPCIIFCPVFPRLYFCPLLNSSFTWVFVSSGFWKNEMAEQQQDESLKFIEALFDHLLENIAGGNFYWSVHFFIWNF